jgi:hypothetical protein
MLNANRKKNFIYSYNIAIRWSSTHQTEHNKKTSRVSCPTKVNIINHWQSPSELLVQHSLPIKASNKATASFD